MARPALAETWLRDHRLLGDDCGVGDGEFLWLLDVRESLRALALANNGVAPEGRALAVLDDAAARTVDIRFGASGAALRARGSGVAGAIGSILSIVIDAMHDGTWRRMKACRRDVCRWLFYDHSRNRVSNWCSMAICGNRAKTRAYRQRKEPAEGR